MIIDCQNALLAHLRTGFDTTTVRTLKQYAGEAKKANHLTQLLPAILVMYTDGQPIAFEKMFEFDILVVVSNDALEKLVAQQNNLELVSDVAKYLREHYTFSAQGKPGTYEILRETTRAQTIVNDHQFNIIAITVQIKDYSE